MKRHLVVGLLAACVAVGGWAVAQDAAKDEPPLRLKKRTRPAEEVPKEEAPQPPAPRPEKPKDDAKEPAKPEEMPGAPGAAAPEMDEQEVLNRVERNMRTAEDRLANRELSDGTRQVQEDIVKDLDLLIQQMQNGGGGEGQQDQQNDQQQQQGGQQQAGGRQRQSGRQQAGMPGNRRGRQRGGRQQASRQQGGQQPGGQQGQQQGGQQPGQQQGQNSPNNQGGGGGRSEGEMNKLAEIYKDVWGHLPETMRQEMNAYSREQFMGKYNDLIRQYYTTIAEKGRRKE